MRAIKYRIWDHKKKKMHYEIEEIHFGFGEIVDKKSTWVPVKVIVTSDDPKWDFERLYDFDLLEYIGFKDKNGKSIYENDFLMIEDLIVEVKWSDFNAGFVFEDESGSHMTITAGNSNQWENIGNPYENPDLLEKK